MNARPLHRFGKKSQGWQVSHLAAASRKSAVQNPPIIRMLHNATRNPRSILHNMAPYPPIQAPAKPQHGKMSFSPKCYPTLRMLHNATRNQNRSCITCPPRPALPVRFRCDGCYTMQHGNHGTIVRNGAPPRQFRRARQAAARENELIGKMHPVLRMSHNATRNPKSTVCNRAPSATPLCPIPMQRMLHNATQESKNDNA